MTPVTNIRIWWDTSVMAYRMASPYNKDLVDGIKAFIPVSDRSFDPASKMWTFVERQLAPLQKLFTTLNVQPQIITRAQAEAAQQSTPQGPRRGVDIATIALEFIKLAGPEAMKKAYRDASLRLHPDRGGNMDQMSTLNAAWARLEKEVLGQ